MKRNSFKLSLVFLTTYILTILPFNGMQAAYAAENASLSYDAAVAYKSVIDEAVAKYGECHLLQGLYVGIGAAKLVDFDGNGTLELLLGYGYGEATNPEIMEYNFFYDIYGYDNGIFQISHTNACPPFEAGFAVQLLKSGNNVYAKTRRGSICEGNEYYETVSDNKSQMITYYTHKGGICGDDFHPEIAGKDIYMINDKVVSENEFNIEHGNYEIYDIYSESNGYIRFDEKGATDVINTLNDVINQNGTPASSDTSNEITGTLSEHYVNDIQCLVLTLDKIRDFQVTSMYGEIYTDENVTEVQIGAKNYTSDMNGTKVKIKSYDEIFEGHSAYHIRPIVINGAILETANDEITVTLNGNKIDFDRQPIIVDNRTLVPLRAIFEALGATVDWNEDTQTVTSTKGNTTISVTIGKAEMYKNGNKIILDVAAQIVDDRTLVPIRAIAESFDITVDWNENTNTVILNEY